MFLVRFSEQESFTVLCFVRKSEQEGSASDILFGKPNKKLDSRTVFAEAILSFRWRREAMQRWIERFFQILQLLCDGAPIVHRFIVEIALLWLLLLGLWHVLKWTS
jgi:hypothetical protein